MGPAKLTLGAGSFPELRFHSYNLNNYVSRESESRAGERRRKAGDQFIREVYKGQELCVIPPGSGPVILIHKQIPPGLLTSEATDAFCRYNDTGNWGGLTSGLTSRVLPSALKAATALST